MNKKQVIIGMTITILVFITVSTGIIFAWDQIKRPGDLTKGKNPLKIIDTTAKVNRTNDNDSSQGDENDAINQETQTNNTNYITKTFENCKEPYKGEIIGGMEIVYPDYVEIKSFSEGDCEIELSYKTGILRFVYTIGEGNTFNIEKDYRILKTEEPRTLVRASNGELPSNEGILHKSYIYTFLYTDSECEDIAKYYIGIRFPCGGGGNPFVTAIGTTSALIEPTTTQEETEDILKVFDDINIRSSSSLYNEAQSQ